jgi:peptidoglycan/LPS O-acetylase OafA/YrhL
MKFTLLDPLRGLAALWVFTFHYPFGPWLAHDLPLVAALFRLGYLGVPLFFVISGYCVTGSARSSLSHGESIGRFAYRRLRRVYPTYWFSLVLAVGLPYWLEIASSLKTGHYLSPAPGLNNGFMAYSPLDWLSVVTLARVFVDVPGATSLQYKFTSLNAVYWTLAIEVQFYVVVAFAMMVRRGFYAALAAITVIGCAATLVPGAYLSGSFLPYWPMFAIGVALYWLLERGVRVALPLGRFALVTTAGVAIASALGFAAYLAVHGAIPDFAVAAAFGAWLLLAFSLDPLLAAWRVKPGRGAARLLPIGVFALGQMSYSLYLVHTKLFPIAYQPVSQVLPAESLACDVAVFALMAAGTYAFYWLAERPFAGATKREPEFVLAEVVAAPAPSLS